MLRETAAGTGKIGTTGRGIGPAYEDKVGRRAIRVCDLAHLDELEPQLDRLCAHHDALRAGFGEPPVDRAALLAELREIAPFVLQYAQPVWKRLKKVRKAGARILFEGAQGVLLDVDHGTYPFVTSSNTVSGTAASGIGPRARARPASCSASSRPTPPASAAGPFPTELDDETGQRLGERGHEFGTVTGRKRRCGWFDAVLVRQSLRDQRRHRHRADQARRARRVRHGARSAPAIACAARCSTISPPRRRSGRGRADLRGNGRLAAKPPPARAAGPTCRRRRSSTSSRVAGTDRIPGRAGLDQPRARRHDPGARSVRGLMRAAAASLRRAGGAAVAAGPGRRCASGRSARPSAGSTSSLVDKSDARAGRSTPTGEPIRDARPASSSATRRSGTSSSRATRGRPRAATRSTTATRTALSPVAAHLLSQRSRPRLCRRRRAAARAATSSSTASPTAGRVGRDAGRLDRRLHRAVERRDRGAVAAGAATARRSRSGPESIDLDMTRSVLLLFVSESDGAQLHGAGGFRLRSDARAIAAGVSRWRVDLRRPRALRAQIARGCRGGGVPCWSTCDLLAELLTTCRRALPATSCWSIARCRTAATLAALAAARSCAPRACGRAAGGLDHDVAALDDVFGCLDQSGAADPGRADSGRTRDRAGAGAWPSCRAWRCAN